MRRLDMQIFDQPAFNDHDAPASGQRRLMRGNDCARLIHFALRGRESRVGRRYLFGVDQGLAIEPKSAALRTSRGEAGIVKIEMHAVEHGEAVGTSR